MHYVAKNSHVEIQRKICFYCLDRLILFNTGYYDVIFDMQLHVLKDEGRGLKYVK